MYSSSSYDWVGWWQVLLLGVFDLDILVGSSILTLMVTALTRFTRCGGGVDIVITLAPVEAAGCSCEASD